MAAMSCVQRLVGLLESHRNGQPVLLYAGLELRYSIERTLFEYLVLVRNFDVPKTMEKLYSAKDLKAEVLMHEPQFFEKIEFMATLAPFIGVPGEVRKPDLDLLADCYGKVGGYLHAPKRPEKTWENPGWWTRLEDIVRSGAEHLIHLYGGSVGFIELNERGAELFSKFASGVFSLADVKAHLEEHYKNKDAQ